MSSTRLLLRRPAPSASASPVQARRAPASALPASSRLAPPPCRCPGGDCEEQHPGGPGRAVPQERLGHQFGRLPVFPGPERESESGAGPQRKEPGVEQEDDEFEGVEGVSRAALAPAAAPRYPHQGAATIVCDGRGGYRVHLGWAATFGCGIADCVRDHELSHITDWQGRWPNGCKNADGTSKRDGTAVPVGGDGYDAFLRRSECTAYTGEVPCEERLLAAASDECKPRVRGVLDDTRRQKTAYCGA